MTKKKFVLLPRTEKLLDRLPQEIRRKFWRQLKILLLNPSYPSLRNKPVKGSREGDWEFSITMNYRALYRTHGNELYVVYIGKHEDTF